MENKEPTRDADDSTSASPRKAPSEAQLRANRANAKKSTGPRSSEGKTRSSANATTHGIYATKCDAIDAGPYLEDAKEISEYVQSIVDALDPSDALEEGVASEVALIYLKERRIAKWEDGQLVEHARAEQMEAAEGRELREDLTYAWIEAWNRERRSAGSAPEMSETDIPWEMMAMHVRKSVAPTVGVKGLWEPGTTPTSSSEWRRAYETLANHHFPSPEDLIDWLIVSVGRPRLMSGARSRASASRFGRSRSWSEPRRTGRGSTRRR